MVKQTSGIVAVKRQKTGLKRQVRIIGGDWRGRKIEFPSIDGLRPSTDRVRETVFNWLQFDLADATVLDMFAGSGVMGFEAASRCAKQVDMLELNVQAVAALQASKALLKADSVVIHHGDALAFVANINAQQSPYQIIFVDPPYAANLLVPALAALATPGVLAAGARLYVEHGAQSALPPLPEQWRILREKKAGDARYYLIEAQ